MTAPLDTLDMELAEETLESSKDPQKNGNLSGGTLTDEVLDSSRKVLSRNRGGNSLVGTQQFFTPLPAAQLIHDVFGRPTAVLDPTAGSGALLALFPPAARFGIEIDRDHTRPRMDATGGKSAPYNAITADVQAVVPMLRAAGITFPALAVNPPFGLTWRDPIYAKGEMNSTTLAFLWSLDLLNRYGQGAMICGRDRLRKEVLTREEAKGIYAIVDVDGPLFDGVALPTSIAFFVRPENRANPANIRTLSTYSVPALPPPVELLATREDLPELAMEIIDLRSQSSRLVERYVNTEDLRESFSAVASERKRRDDEARAKRATDRYDISLRGQKVGVTLSPYAKITLAKEGTVHEVKNLHNQHSAYFAQNKRSWKKLIEFRDKNLIIIDPALEEKVSALLEEAKLLGTPLFELRPQMRLGWLTDLDRIPCIKDDPDRGFKAGNEYHITTDSKIVTEFETRLKQKKDGTQEPREFERERKLLQITINEPDNYKVHHTFNESNENIKYLMEHFEIPDPGSVATVFPNLMRDRYQLLKHIARKNGFTYKNFQLDHYSRLLVKGRGMLAHEQGLGKSLGLLSLAEAQVILGAENKVLIVAPQDLLNQWGRESKKFFNRRLQIISNPVEAKRVQQYLDSGGTGWYISYYEALSTVGRANETLPHRSLFPKLDLDRRLTRYHNAKKYGVERISAQTRPLPSYTSEAKDLFSFATDSAGSAGSAGSARPAKGAKAKKQTSLSTIANLEHEKPASADGFEPINDPKDPDSPHSPDTSPQDDPYSKYAQGVEDMDMKLATTAVACPNCGATTYDGWDGVACHANKKHFKPKRCVTHGPFEKVKECPPDGAGCVMRGCNYTHRAKYAKSSYTHLTSAFKNGVVCIDEISEIRGDDSLRSKAIRGITRGPHIYGATGTPLSNFINDAFWGLLVTFSAGSIVFPYSHVSGKAKFENDFCTIEYLRGREQDGEENQRKNRKILPEITNVSQFWRLTQPLISRCRKEQTGEPIVPRTYLPVEVPMGVEQTKSHYFWLKNFTDYFMWKYPDHPMSEPAIIEKWAAALGQLWHLERAATMPASEPAIHEWETAEAQIGNVSNWTPANLTVLELAMKHVEKGEKVLIGSDLIYTGKWISDRLCEKNVKSVNITEESGTGENRKITTKNPRKRAREVQEFVEGDAQVLCAGIAAMKLGHNLDVASTVIVHGLPYSFMSMSQFIARVHRLTSKFAVSVYVVLPKFSLAESKWSLLQNKGGVSDLAFDGELKVQPEKPIDWNKVIRDMRKQSGKNYGKEVHESEIFNRWEKVPSIRRAALRLAEESLTNGTPTSNGRATGEATGEATSLATASILAPLEEEDYADYEQVALF